MTPKARHSVMLDPELAEGLKVLKTRDGASEGESIRRALADYLKKKGVAVKTDRRRGGARKRP